MHFRLPSDNVWRPQIFYNQHNVLGRREKFIFGCCIYCCWSHLCFARHSFLISALKVWYTVSFISFLHYSCCTFPVLSFNWLHALLSPCFFCEMCGNMLYLQIERNGKWNPDSTVALGSQIVLNNEMQLCVGCLLITRGPLLLRSLKFIHFRQTSSMNCEESFHKFAAQLLW